MNELEQETANSLKVLKQKIGSRLFWRRLYDTKSFQKISKMAMAIKQAGDFYGIVDGHPLLIECKQTHNLTSYNFDYIDQHQFNSLIEFQEAGGLSYFFLSRRGRTKGAVVCYVIRPDDLIRIRDKHLSIGRKSAKWDEILLYATPLERIDYKDTEKAWDLAPLFRGVGIDIVDDIIIRSSVDSFDSIRIV